MTSQTPLPEVPQCTVFYDKYLPLPCKMSVSVISSLLKPHGFSRTQNVSWSDRTRFSCPSSAYFPSSSLQAFLHWRPPRMGAEFLSFAVVLLLVGAAPVSATTFTLVNKCRHVVWPGIQPSAGKGVLARGGLRLMPREAVSIGAPAGWSGRIWGRHGCLFDAGGKGTCATGDCGGVMYCNGAGGAPPATLAEFTLGAQDFYDVSLVDGYNLPIAIAPRRGSGKCTYAGCVSDLNRNCPPALQVRSGRGRVLACKSACFAFNAPQYCCTGSYANPHTCRPTAYSRLFKNACPRAYSYAYDDPSSIVTCSGADYLITFCPH